MMSGQMSLPDWKMRTRQTWRWKKGRSRPLLLQHLVCGRRFHHASSMHSCLTIAARLCLFHSRPAKSSNTWPGHGPLRQSKVNTKLHVVQGNVLVGGPGFLSFDCTDGKFVPVSAFACSPAPSRTSHRGSLFRKFRSVRVALHVTTLTRTSHLLQGARRCRSVRSWRLPLLPPSSVMIWTLQLEGAMRRGRRSRRTRSCRGW